MKVVTNQYRRLRISVLGLGALVQNPWWKTPSISPVGLKSLGLVFPRTYSNAAVTAASEIACRVHDEKIGKGRVFICSACHLTWNSKFSEICTD